MIDNLFHKTTQHKPKNATQSSVAQYNATVQTKADSISYLAEFIEILNN